MRTFAYASGLDSLSLSAILIGSNWDSMIGKCPSLLQHAFALPCNCFVTSKGVGLG